MAQVLTPQSLTAPTVRLGPVQQLVDGRWVGSRDGATLSVECPANRQVIAEIPSSNGADIDEAVNAARGAFGAWSRMLPTERGRLLQKIADALDAGAEELALIVAHETGNALRTQSRPEAYMVGAVFRYFGGLASELKGMNLPLGDSVLSYTRREPLGVVGAIVPWNSPVGLAACKLAPALCAGNTVVLKPAEDAPLGVLWMAEVCSRFLPPGVLNVVTGTGSVCGAALVNHPGVDKLTFTGSTGVGKGVMAAAAARVLPVSLELGGKSPSIVTQDADEDWVAVAVASAMRFTRQSQSCTAGSRLFVHERVFDSFLDRLAQHVQGYSIGNPLDEATDMGTLINRRQFDRVRGYIAEGLSTQGVRTVVGGLPPEDGPLAAGYYCRPTIFASPTNEWKLAREEIFGPVLVAIPWRDDDEVVRMANDSHYGLAAYVFSRDTARALRMAHRIDAGWVQVNQGKSQQLGQPYGGFKQSGLGKELSLDSMVDGFSRLKSVTVNLDLP
jgi:betaine-aldehyde dehydrogenase